MKKKVALSCISLLMVLGVSAQQIDSVLNIYADNFQQEKIYVHFDKYVYNKGETIWFKAYLFLGTDISNLSKNVYIDFFDATGKLLKHFIAPVYHSSAKGQFDIPEKYTSQIVHVRAYTSWMLNFDSSFFFNKDVLVFQPQKLKLPTAIPKTQIHFFPEGGDLVEGLSSRVAFLATDSLGKPVKIRGAIKKQNGTIIDSFMSVHDGMGTFTVDATKEQYKVDWIDQYGKKYTSHLPQAKAKGIVLEVQPVAGKTIFSLKRTAKADSMFKTLYVIATINQQMVYKARINFSVKDLAVAEIPTVDFPTGIMQLTVFSASWIPIAERIVFINNDLHEFYAEVNTVVKGTGKRSKNVLEINVPDTVAANLSIAITDADILTDKNTIYSQLISNDIKGYIYHPDYYFSNTTDSVAHHLDLVMLTHGWRRINWENILAAKFPEIKYPAETHQLQFTGKFFGGMNTKFAHNEQLLSIVYFKDNSKKSFILPLNEDGSFFRNNFLFFDTAKVYYKLIGTQQFINAEPSFQNGLISAQYQLIAQTPSSELWNLYDSAFVANMQKSLAEQKKLQQLMQTTTLSEVIVRTKTKSPIELLDEKYTSGLFAGDNDGYRFDVENDIRAVSSLDVLHYLQGMVPGLQITDRGGNNWALTWRNDATDLFVDEMPANADLVNSLAMADIAYVKVFRPPFFGSLSGGSGGAVAIYTKKGGSSKNTSSKETGLSFKFLEGYSTYKQFYSPDYSLPVKDFTPDTRTTIYWNPYILTNRTNKTARIQFYNSDIVKRMRVILEGVNTEGKLVRVEQIIE